VQGLRSGLEKEVVEVWMNKKEAGLEEEEVGVWRKNTGSPKKHGKLQSNRTLEKNINSRSVDDCLR
jgi:hypothetical protein